MTWVNLYFGLSGAVCGLHAANAYRDQRKGALGFWVIWAACNIAMAGYVDGLQKMVAP